MSRTMIFTLGDRKQDNTLVLKDSESGGRDKVIHMNQLRPLNCGVSLEKEFREGGN